MEEQPAGDSVYVCPNCAREVVARPLEVAQLLACPHCQWEFVLPSATGSAELPENAAARDPEQDQRHEGQLDTLRVRQIATARRAAFRGRTYLILAMGVCAVAAAQWLFGAVLHLVRGTGGWRPWAYVPLGLAALGAAGFFLKQVRLLTAEMAGSALDGDRACPRCGRLVNSSATRCGVCDAEVAALPKPDFSSLGDGSEQVRNLERLRPPHDV